MNGKIMSDKTTEAKWVTAAALAENPELKAGIRTIESCHLHFNGPGASGFGVKRTAMLLPESVMLLVAPACCGRHGTVTGKKTGFYDRMFYLQIDERDLVTGRYLNRIPAAAAYIKEKYAPKVLYLCMTCVDAIMGTDLVRIGKKIEDSTGLRVTASFMDPISRESRRSPMVSVIQSLFRTLDRTEPVPGRVNIIGGFVPVDRRSELFDILKAFGKTDVREISACTTFDEYQEMAGAVLNIVINPQAEAAAADMKDRLGIPYVILDKTYGTDRTKTQLEKLVNVLIQESPLYHSEYHSEQPVSSTAAAAKPSPDAFAAAEASLHASVSDGSLAGKLSLSKASADAALRTFISKHKDMKIAIGEAVNGNPFEMALTLIEAGADVPWVLRNIITQKDIEYIKQIAAVSPGLKIYSGVHPGSQAFGLPYADAVIGMDGAYLAQSRVSVNFGMENEDFGYHLLSSLIAETDSLTDNPVGHRKLMHGSYLTV